MNKCVYVIVSESPARNFDTYKAYTCDKTAWDKCVELQKEYPEYDWYYACVDLEEEE